MAQYTYAQTPECGYDYTAVYTWSWTGDPITVDGNTAGVVGPQINVFSMKPADAATYAVSMTAVLTIADNNGATDATFPLDQTQDTVTFDVVVANPCLTADIDAITGWTNPLIVVDGETAETEWDSPQTDLDAEMGDVDLCGPRAFEVYLDEQDTPLTPTYSAEWAAITQPTYADTFRLTVDTTADLSLIGNEDRKDITLYVKTWLVQWPSTVSYDAITIRVQQTNCDCSYL
jgi:hypothetical protein